jgi:hypothetical protein
VTVWQSREINFCNLTFFNRLFQPVNQQKKLFDSTYESIDFTSPQKCFTQVLRKQFGIILCKTFYKKPGKVLVNRHYDKSEKKTLWRTWGKDFNILKMVHI